jgi:hypothetical protein
MGLCLNIGSIAVALIAFAGFLCSADSTHAKSARSDARYWVQSGAFKSAANARARCEVLQKRGYRFAVQNGPDSHGENLFFCRSARTMAYDQAASLAKRLRSRDLRDAVLVLRRPTGVPERGAAATKSGAPGPGSLESFSGAWCGDPAVYGSDPLQTWTVKKGGTVMLKIAGRGRPDGEPARLQGKLEQLPENLIKLTGETMALRFEAIYGIDASGLRGVSLRQEIKGNGASMTTIPDSLHRCP